VPHKTVFPAKAGIKRLVAGVAKTTSSGLLRFFEEFQPAIISLLT